MASSSPTNKLVHMLNSFNRKLIECLLTICLLSSTLVNCIEPVIAKHEDLFDEEFEDDDEDFDTIVRVRAMPPPSPPRLDQASSRVNLNVESNR